MKRMFLCGLALAVSLVTAGFSGPARADEKPASAEGTKVETKRVDLNASNLDELVELPGIGEKVAARILAYREKNGPFKKVEELMNVKGIGEKTFLRLRPRLFVGPTQKD